MLKKLFAPLIAWYLAALKTAGYPVIVLLMTMESSVLPLPSEVIIPPAAHLAHTGQIPLHYVGIVLCGILGSWLGATIVYWCARLAGRPLVARYGKFVLFPPEKLAKAENWSAQYGAAGVFVARLLPGARQLVGIPAGIAKMDYKLFSLFTVLGAAIWCSVLCWLGVKVGDQIDKGEMHKVVLSLLAFVAAAGALYYFFVHRPMSAGGQKVADSTSGK
jgi:membrane protein DedA with SNARE-associated domain